MRSTTWMICSKIHICVYIYTYTSEEDVCLLQTYCVLHTCKNIQPLFLDQPHLLTYLCVVLLYRCLCAFLFREGQLFFTNEIQDKGKISHLISHWLPIASSYMITAHKNDTPSEALGIKKELL